MPGSVYYRIAKQVASWLSTVDECKINASTKIISESLGDITLEENTEIVSFDVYKSTCYGRNKSLRRSFLLREI